MCEIPYIYAVENGSEDAGNGSRMMLAPVALDSLVITYYTGGYEGIQDRYVQLKDQWDHGETKLRAAMLVGCRLVETEDSK